MNFREYLLKEANEEIVNEKNTFFQKIKKAAKRLFSGGEIEFYAPLLKGIKAPKAGKKPYGGYTLEDYKLFVDYSESVGYYDNKDNTDEYVLNTFSMEEIPNYEVHDLIKKYESKMQVEEDKENKYYLFVSGIGAKSDVEDFIKNELNGVDFISRKWEY